MDTDFYITNYTISSGKKLSIHRLVLLHLNQNKTINMTNTEDYLLPINDVDHDIQKIILPLLCLIGIIGNTASATLFFGRHLRCYSCSIFLGVRSISDNGFLVSLLIVWLDFVNIRIFHTTGICHIVVCLAYVCSFMSVWCVVCVTIENYIRISHQVAVKLYCTPRTALYAVGLITLISACLYNVPLWTNEISELYESYFCATKNEFVTLQIALTYVDTAVTLIIPLIIILSLMAVILVRALKNSKRRLRLGDHRSKKRTAPSYGTVAGLLSAVSITFISLHTPIHIFKLKVIFETISGDYDTPSEAYRFVGSIFQVMYYLNCSVNVLVYYICGKNFRRVFKKTFCSGLRCNSNIDEDYKAVKSNLTELLAT